MWYARLEETPRFVALGAIFDRKAPEVTLLTPFTGIGASPREISFRLADERGISMISVSVTQADKIHHLLSQTIPDDAPRAQDIVVRLDAGHLQLVAGTATLTLVASDRSLWGHAVTFTKQITVDYTRPLIVPLTTQQNGSVGGAELVVFRYTGRPISRAGVRVRDRIFDAVPVEVFDPSVRRNGSVFVSLFAVPFDFHPEDERLKLVATDDFGATAETLFNYRISKRAVSHVEMKLPPAFFSTKVPELLSSFKRGGPVPQGADVYDLFRLVNEDLRRENDEMIKKVIAESVVRERLWKGAFIRPMAAAPKASFAEKRLYKKDKHLLSESLHMGIDLADVEHAPVKAANAGQVIFAGNLGIYGELVIVDHGLGVTTLYGHLSSQGVKVGDKVLLGQEIGRSGATGLAGGDHLHFEVRIQGEPVSPVAWWDGDWIDEHIEGKVKRYEEPSG